MITVDPLVSAALESDTFNMAHLVDLPGGLFFTDWPNDLAYGGESYVSNGKLLSLSSIVREGGIKTHSHTLKLSAVEADIITHFESQPRGGETCIIRRVILDDAGAIIAGQAMNLYQGTLDGWSLMEGKNTASISIKLTNNWAANAQTSGRRTTQHSQQEVLSTDTFFEHAHIETSNIDWGKK